ncbi:ribosome small subunit-dependent GTPase A [Enterococcus cecorum]|uniref:ribosome small subunit-dependent GTPase A n=1 Tax=Enterococcus cecorum TaxID=44008 RepID=UPI001FADB9F9|nr:ribosome small subunit-dependent GTPase A [Enterococcus cecorum]MCJ0523074.1 ribosome small subunit-dependent GTPase A [Enterococcus cecorum]MCJ0559862.1 ribosome small subunit-dependent GTPase A [Enterococcus cecorum]MCJ0572853.1 ribosome small subunit-dependent GTPase A [Enterococcus cecorum]MCJ0578053.1 ribosome small subunit-dependent GTPase A [Enterococcus cecorum]MCJ0582535.1 ribosome small subunit-dependent GTPase A [Enterococcus cecorum]
MQGQLKKALSGFYYIQHEGNLYQTRARGNFRKRKVKPLVGDFVEFESTSLTDGYLLEIFPRKNELVRPPVANVDQVIVVASLVEPDFSYHLLDRFLVSLEQKQIESVIYLSKVDLLDDTTLLEEIKATYHLAGYRVIVGDKNGLNQVKALLKNRLTVLAGQSGAGKSTLLNQLVPGLALETGEISEALNRGKHTTRHVELIDVAKGLVADTPGFSSIDFFDLEVTDLPKMFPEFVVLQDACRFRECSHTHEPDCAVKEALAEGKIAQIRYDNYLLFLQELKNQRPTYQKKKNK